MKRSSTIMLVVLSLTLITVVTVWAQTPTVEVPMDGMEVIRVGSPIDRVVVGSSDLVRARVVTGKQIMLFGLNSGSTTLHVWTEQGLRRYNLEVAEFSSTAVGDGDENLLQEVGTVNEEGQELRIYTPEYRSVTEFEQYISELIRDRGEVVLSDSSSGKIFVLAPPDLLDRVESLLNEVDVPGKNEVYTRRIVLKNRSASGLSEKIEKMISGDGSVVVDEETNSLLIVDEVSNVKKIENYLKSVDVPTTRQVRIEARFVELNEDVTRELGVDWTFEGSVDGENMDIGLLPELNPTDGLSANIGNDPIDNLSASLKALESENMLDLISSPNVVTRNQQEAKLEILNEQSYLAGCNVDQTDGAISTTPQVETTEDGITLEVTPLIGNNDIIQLDVIPELRLVSFDSALNVDSDCGTIRFPNTDRRRAELNVALKDGQTLVIGGLNRNEQDDESTEVPFFSDIPVLGGLFQQSTNETNDKEITIFLTAHIVPMSDETGTDTSASVTVGDEEADPTSSTETTSETPSEVTLD